MTDTMLLLQGEAARREIRQSVDEAVRRAMAEHGGTARQLYELLADQRAILTARRLADLLGVSARTVTERYVKRGLPHVRLATNGPPLFLLEDVIAWLREADVEGAPSVTGSDG